VEGFVEKLLHAEGMTAKRPSISLSELAILELERVLRGLPRWIPIVGDEVAIFWTTCFSETGSRTTLLEELAGQRRRAAWAPRRTLRLQVHASEQGRTVALHDYGV
jgi:hypothetical protein